MHRCKKILNVTIIGIILSIFMINSNVYAWCNTVVANKDITAVRLTLSNGTVLHDITLKKGLNNVNTSTKLKDLKIFFIVDTSDSMSSSLSAVKSSMTIFINNIYSFYNKKSVQLQTAVIGFDEETSSNEDDKVELYTNRDDVKQQISNLSINNSNRDISQATKIGLDNMSQANNNRLLQVVIFITDCDIQNVTDEIADSATKDLTIMSNENMALMYACSINRQFNNTVAGKILSSVPEVILIENQGSIGYWVPEVTDTVKNRVVDFSTVIPTVNSTTANSFTTIGNDVILYIDDELLHGALLEVEYLITASRQCDVIDNIGSNFTFTKSNHFITNPSQTNDNYGWNLDEKTSMIKSTGKSQYKLILSTVLTPTTIPDSGYKNTAYCFFSNYKRTIESGVVKVLPPFGNIKNTTSENFYLIALVVSISSLIFITLLINAVKKKIKRKVKI